MGQIVQSKGDIRKRSKDSLIWVPIHKSDTVDSKDVIHTGVASETQIKFNNGALLKIHPFSSVRLEEKLGKTEVTARAGGVELVGVSESGEGLNIKQGSSKKSTYYGKESVGQLVTRSSTGRQEYFQPVRVAGDPSSEKTPKNPNQPKLNGPQPDNSQEAQTIKMKKGLSLEKKSDGLKEQYGRTLLLGYLGIFAIIGLLAFIVNVVIPRLTRKKSTEH